MDMLKDPKHRSWFQSGDKLSTPLVEYPLVFTPGSAELMKGWDHNETPKGTLPRLESTPERPSIHIDISDDDGEILGVNDTVEDIIKKLNSSIAREPSQEKTKKVEESGPSDCEMDNVVKMESEIGATLSSPEVVYKAEPIAQSFDTGTWHDDIILARSLQGSGSGFQFMEVLEPNVKSLVDFLFYDSFLEVMEIPADVNDSVAGKKNAELQESLSGNFLWES